VSPEAVAKIRKAVIDKDQSEWAALLKVLGRDVIIELCLFHTQKAMKEHTKDISDKNTREATRSVLQKLVYAESEEKYDEYVKELESVAPRDQYEYFMKNWDNIREAWVSYEKLFLPNFGNNTTKRVENKNRHLKSLLDTHCSLSDTIGGILLSHKENKERSVAYKNYEAVSKETYVAGNEDPDVANILATCSTFSAKLILHQLSLMERPHKFTSDGETCKCTFFKSMALPCRHIFLSRHERGT